MTAFARTDRSLLGRWWWTVDRWNLVALVLLMLAGVVLVMAASPPVAERIGVPGFHFVTRHFLFLLPALATMFVLSLLEPAGVRLAALALLALSLALLVATPLLGAEIKGARRWISLGSFSLQASEFVKPALAVVAAWLLASARQRPGFPGGWLSAALAAAVLALLVWQPDFGMAATVAAIWGGQLFLAGLPLLLVGAAAAAAIAGLGAGYALMPHVRDRIDRFLDPESGDSYQVDTAMRAFEAGGLLGRGPGDGVVKNHLPDAHSDFIFAVAGEEFGLLACLLLVAAFAFVALRGMARAGRGGDLFAMLAVAGLAIQFAMQAAVNMGVSLQLVPATGMTLPLVSYGGSALMGMAVTMGMVLALTRRRPGHARAPRHGSIRHGSVPHGSIMPPGAGSAP